MNPHRWICRTCIPVLLALAWAALPGCPGSGSSGDVGSEPAATIAPSVTSQPQDATVAEGAPATFTVNADGSAPLSYQWRKDGVDISGATAASYTTPAAQPSDSGARFSVAVTNARGSAVSDEAILTVTSGSISPVAQFEDDFSSEIDESLWQIATWSEHGGQTGRERCYSEDGVLNMVFVNDSAHGYLSAAIQTWDTFLYGRWEARLKPSSVPGVLNSMYTIDWGAGDGTKQEIDIEFLTYTFEDSAGEVHFAVHADGLPSFNTNPDIELPFNPSDDFHVWGFEITPEHVQWFVDDQVLLTYTYSASSITIDAPYQLKFNVWSAQHWINGPPAADTPCVYRIDWIRFYPYLDG